LVSAVVMTISEQIQTLSQETVGKVSVAIGGGGTTIQILTDWGSIFVLGGNALLVTGGLYLMTSKIRTVWRGHKVSKYLGGKKEKDDDP